MDQKPKLYLFIGYPGAGKTTIAQLIEENSQAVHIWADAERHKVFNNPTHSHQESTDLYIQLNKKTEALLSQGKSVIFDTNFNYFSDRQRLRDIADAQNAETVVVWITTPYDLAKQRAVHDSEVRNGYEYTMSETQFESIAAKLEEPHKSEIVIKIDGTNIDRAAVKQLLQL